MRSILNKISFIVLTILLLVGNPLYLLIGKPRILNINLFLVSSTLILFIYSIKYIFQNLAVKLDG